MSKAVLTLKIWDDRRKPSDVDASESDLQVSTMAEGQFQVIAGSDVVVINSEQALVLSDFLADNANNAAADPA